MLIFTSAKQISQAKSLIVKKKKKKTVSYITQRDAPVRIYLNLFVSKREREEEKKNQQYFLQQLV